MLFYPYIYTADDRAGERDETMLPKWIGINAFRKILIGLHINGAAKEI